MRSWLCRSGSGSLSVRRAGFAGQHRSTQRHGMTVAQDDAALRVALRAFSCRRPRWGHRRAHQHLLEQGWTINRKRAQRLWREEGLRVPAKRRKRQRRGESTVPGDRLRAERPDHVWAFDFVRHEALCDREGVRDLFCQPVAAGW